MNRFPKISLLAIMILAAAAPLALAATWTQSDWTGGSGQLQWSDSSKFSTNDPSIDFTQANLITMYPSAEWWNTSYKRRIQFKVTNNHPTVQLPGSELSGASGYAVAYTIPHAAWVAAGLSLNNGNDIRICYRKGVGNWVDLERINEEPWNSSSVKIWFRLYRAIPAATVDTEYYIYYNNPAAASPATLDTLFINLASLTSDTYTYTAQAWRTSGNSSDYSYSVSASGRTFHAWGDLWRAYDYAFPTSFTTNITWCLEFDYKWNPSTVKPYWSGPILDIDKDSATYARIWNINGSNAGHTAALYNSYNSAGQYQEYVLPFGFANVGALPATPNRNYLTLTFMNEYTSTAGKPDISFCNLLMRRYVSPEPTLSDIPQSEFVSSIFDMGQPTSFTNKKIQWTHANHAGTVMETWIKTGDDPLLFDSSYPFLGPLGDSTPYTCTAGGVSIPTVHDGYRYVQYKVSMHTFSTALPRLNSVSIGYNAGPEAFSLLSPPNSKLINNSDVVEFEWEACVDQDNDLSGYRLFYSREPDFSEGLTTVKTLAAGRTKYTSQIASTDFPGNGSVFWKVEAFDSLGQFKESNSIGTFNRETPTLINPIQPISPIGETNLCRPTFIWTKQTRVYPASGIANDGSYDFELHETSSSTSPILEAYNSAAPTYATSYTLGMNLVPGVTYYWRVRYTEDTSWAGGSQPWCAMQKLKYTVPVPSPGAPQGTKILPVVASPGYDHGLMKPTFVWGAPSTVNTFEVEVYKGGTSPANKVLDLTGGSALNSTSTYRDASFAALLNVTYNWRVRSVDSAGNRSLWSTPMPFKYILNAASPTAPDKETNMLRPVFQWVGVPGATAYQIKLTTAGVSSYANTPTAATVYTWAADLGLNKTYSWNVRALNSGGTGNAGPVSVSKSFMYRFAEVDMTSGSPVDFTTSTLPTYSWSPVEASGAPAAKYKLEIKKSGVLQWSGILAVASPAAPAYQAPFGLTPGMTYQWRVVPVNENDEVSNYWSDLLTFKVNLGDPTLVSPRTKSPRANPEFVWNAVAGATKYSLEVKLGAVMMPGYPTLVTGATSFDSATSGYTIEMETGKSYAWRIMALNDEGAKSVWSDANSFVFGMEPPVINQSGTVTNYRTPTVQWNASPDATEYVVQAATDSAYLSQLPGSPWTVAAPSVSLSTNWSLMADTTYYYRVRALNASLTSTWASKTLTFKMDVPGAISPNGKIAARNPVLVWNPVDGDVLGYEVQVKKGSLVVLGPALTTGTSYSTSLLPLDMDAGNYAWQVRAMNSEAGYTGAWSGAKTIYLYLAKADAKAMASPRTWVTTANPVFSFGSVANADGYEVEVHLGSATGAKVTLTPSTCTGTALTTTANLTPGKVYYWKVRARMLGGSDYGSAWTKPMKFTYAYPDLVSLDPGANADARSNSPVLSWANAPVKPGWQVGTPTGYQVEVKLGAAHITPNPTYVAGTAYTSSFTLAPGKSYVWRVRAYDAGGAYSLWNKPLALKIQLAQVSSKSMRPSAFCEDIKPLFTWPIIPGADLYDFEFMTGTTARESSTTLVVNSWKSATLVNDMKAHKWRVRAKTSAGVYGLWSTWVTFSFKLRSPALSSPKGNITVGTYNDGRPTFSWAGVPGADYYMLEVREKSMTGPLMYQVDRINSNSYQASAASRLRSRNSYYWRVRACSNLNALGAWSVYASFKYTRDGMVPAPEVAAEGLSLSVMPNPLSTQARVVFTSPSGQATVRLYNAEGRQVWNRSQATSGRAEVTLDRSGLKPGLYQLVVETAGGRISERVVIR